MARAIRWWLIRVFATVLTFGVACVAIDAFQRWQSLSVLFDSTANPPREAVIVAQRNLIYLFGLGIGTASGIGGTLACFIWSRIFCCKRQKQTSSVVGGFQPLPN